MAVVKVSQIAPGRAGKAFNDYNREYTVPFQVIVDDSRDGLFVVASAVDPNTGVRIPPRYAEYAGYENDGFDLYALCTDLDIKQDSNWQKWIVNAKFETNFQTQKQEDPEDDPVIFWVETEFEKRKVTKEYDGTAIVNSSGQLLDGLEANFPVYSYCFLRNELEITSLLDTYNCAVNSASYNGRAKYTLLCQITVDKQQRRNEYVFWPHTYRLKYNPDGWPVDPVDRGTMVLRADGTLGRPVEATTNNPIDGEICLDGKGGMLGPGLPVVYLSAATKGAGNGTGKPKMLQAPQPFSTLNLPPF